MSDRSSDVTPLERRHPERTPENAGWEAKVLARVSGRLHGLLTAEQLQLEDFGWESQSLTVLREHLLHAAK